MRIVNTQPERSIEIAADDDYQPGEKVRVEEWDATVVRVEERKGKKWLVFTWDSDNEEEKKLISKTPIMRKKPKKGKGPDTNANGKPTGGAENNIMDHNFKPDDDVTVTHKGKTIKGKFLMNSAKKGHVWITNPLGKTLETQKVSVPVSAVKRK